MGPADRDFLLSPATRFGYLIYRVALYRWAVLADREQESRRNRPVADVRPQRPRARREKSFA